jgi:hypothetical protein
MPAVERVQRNLWRKLGLAEEDYASVEGGPLPAHIVAAMTAIFDLDDVGADMIHDAPLQDAGHAVDDLQPDAVSAA